MKNKSISKDSVTTDLFVKKGEYNDGIAYVNNEFVPIADAHIPILDWGFLRSDATYDVAHIWNGKFFRLDAHLTRFERSISKLNMRLSLSQKEIIQVLTKCAQLSGLRQASAQIVCTRGIAPIGSRDPRECKNQFYAFIIPFIWIATPEQQQTGISASISKVRRIPPSSVDPTVKNFHWLDLISGLYEVYEHGSQTAILTDSENNITEGPGFNIFVVKNKKVSTPNHGVLGGITRQTIIDIVDRSEFKLQVDKVTVQEIQRADEIFATSTAGGVMPITTLDGNRIGNGSPGPVTLELARRYWQLHEDSRFTIPIDYA